MPNHWAKPNLWAAFRRGAKRWHPPRCAWAHAMQTLRREGSSMHLGGNIDHVATIRQARRVDYPDPIQA
ncbi:MAG: hypothetical protein D6771_09040, partial [Zetaproteobacteria bacterium]